MLPGALVQCGTAGGIVVDRAVSVLLHSSVLRRR